jgi:CheY-like chemotaxis protein
MERGHLEMEYEKKLIMLVDDSISYLKLGQNVLGEKFTVITVPSAAKMFSLLDANRPALILLDIEMPEMNGYEAIKLLKSKEETRDIPVIFLTGDTDPENKAEAFRLGAADYIVKPFPPSALLERIEKFISGCGQVLSEENDLRPCSREPG